MADAGKPVALVHPKWGACELVGVEGTDWIVRFHANGRSYRFPPGARSQFVKAGDGQTAAPTDIAKPAADVAGSAKADGLATVRHAILGLGELLRIEITDWIVRFRSNGRTYRYPPEARGRLTVLDDRTPGKSFSGAGCAASKIHDKSARDPATAAYPGLSAENRVVKLRDPDARPPLPPDRSSTPPAASPEPNQVNTAGDAAAAVCDPDRRRALRVIEALRNGLPPVSVQARGLAVGFEKIAQDIGNLLHDVDAEGGRAMVIKGEYGQGKSFTLQLLQETALAANFAVVRTEVDASENRLNKPHHIYRDLIAHLRLPATEASGKAALGVLAARAAQEVRRATQSITQPDLQRSAARSILQREIGCGPVAWLLSDLSAANKPPLLSLWACDPGVRIQLARASHQSGGEARDWPAFNAGTQGDLASYLLSGLGRLCRYVGYKGLVIVLDEMEKWQDLNWKEQSQAGNLLGGLIWGATAERGARGRPNEPRAINHSLRAGGFPFTTSERSHTGVAIAMTPRGSGSPDELWNQYGLLEIAYLPQLTAARLVEYCTKVAPHYASAYGLPAPNGELTPIASQAVAIWRRAGELTARSGVQAAVAAFDVWRSTLAAT